jgi:hypothetical protein
MRCKDVEHLLLDCSLEDLSKDTLEKMQQHISRCAICASLEDDLRKIRFHLQEIQSQIPSDELLKRTRELCHAQLNTPSIPKYIWAALAALLVLTGVLMLPFAKELLRGQPLSFPLVSTLVLIIQNLAMLFCAPVLIQRFRSRKKDAVNGFMSSGPRQA